MKQCPKCNRDYSDPTLEFCLDDGSRLVPRVPTRSSVETVVMPRGAAPAETSRLEPTVTAAPTDKLAAIKTRALERGYVVLEHTPIVLALAHNYWQWIFADKQHVSPISDYLLSAAFIVWLLLLLGGLGVSLLALKLGRRKSFAVTALVIFAVNFLLFIVPRR